MERETVSVVLRRSHYMSAGQNRMTTFSVHQTSGKRLSITYRNDFLKYFAFQGANRVDMCRQWVYTEYRVEPE